MHWLLRFCLLPVLFSGAATVTIERSAVPSSFFQYDENNVENENERCDYAGEIVLTHPMSVEKDDRYYVLGSQMLESAHISLNAINLWPRCGVHLNEGNYSLRLRTYGDQSSTNMTALIGQAIVHDNATDFMLAGYSSTLTSHLAPIAQENQRLLLTAGSSRTSVHAERDHVFGLLPTSGSFLEEAFRGLASKGAKTVAFLTEEDVNSCLDTPTMAEQYNMEFLNGTILPEDAPYESYAQVADHFAQLNPDVVITCIRTQFASWNQALRETGWSPKAQIYTIVVGTPEFEQSLGTDLAFVMGVSSWDRALPPVPDGATGWTPADFDQAFETAAFRRPAYQHASQSAAISVLVQALERVGHYQDQPAIRNEIASGYFSTVYGNVSFDENGQSAVPNLLLQYDSNGTLHVLLPSTLHSTDFDMVYPMPGFPYRDCEMLSACVKTNGTCTQKGTCDCQYFGAVSEGVGPTAVCVNPPEETPNYLALSLGFVAVALFVVGTSTYVYNKKVVHNRDDSGWKIPLKELVIDDPPEVIGRGHFGVVVLAEYRGTQVAVKRVLPPKDWKPRAEQGFGRTSMGGFQPSMMEQKETFVDEEVGGKDDNKQKKKLNSGMRSFDRSVGSIESVDKDGPNAPMSASLYSKLKKEFMAEMRYLNGLRHPNIITVLGAVMESNGEPMLVMEYMQHGCFYSMLHNETMALDDETLLPILKDVSSGCRFLHAANPPCLHGDLKSANILVDDKMRAKVADFGLAGVRGKAGGTGTPFWMAPELLRGDSSNSTASDVYSFGIVIYEAYSRKDPYEGEDKDARQVLAQVADQKVNRRPHRPKECPSQIASLMKDCLGPSPDERPTFEEVDIRLKRVEVRPQEDANKSSLSLYDMFPKHIADALKSGQRVEAEHKDSVTIFFSDIVNYTSISSELDPRKVAGMLDRLYQKFDSLSDKHEVFKVETIGDAYMAVTNLVKDQHSDHAVRIAAFAIDAIKAANETLIDPDNPDLGVLSIRCGFHSGPVVADVVGSRSPRYCLFGDSVNTASRMESNSDKNRILCSRQSVELLRAQNCKFGINRRGKIRPKGKGEMLVYWIGEEGGPSSESVVGEENRPRPSVISREQLQELEETLAPQPPGISWKRNNTPPKNTMTREQ